MNKSRTLLSAREDLVCPGEEPPLAAHLIVSRTFYTHHGIYVGLGKVIHYAGFACGWRRGPVEEITLAQFCSGRELRVRRDLARFDGNDAINRARSRLGECQYRLLTNNCEHFCNWALREECRSEQAESLRGLVLPLWAAVHAALNRCLLPWRSASTQPARRPGTAVREIALVSQHHA